VETFGHPFSQSEFFIHSWIKFNNPHSIYRHGNA
jgi:hypothetical protein